MACLLSNSGASMVKLWGVRIVLWLYKRMSCSQQTEASVSEIS